MSSSGRPGSGEGDRRRWRHLHLWEVQAVRDLLLFAAVVGLVWLGYAMRSVTTPLLVALALAYLFEPLVRLLTVRWNFTRTAAVSMILCGLAGALVLGVALSAPLVIRQASSLVSDLHEGRLLRSMQRIQTILPETLQPPFNTMLQTLGLGPPPEAAALEAGAEPGAPDEASPKAPAEEHPGIGRDLDPAPSLLLEAEEENRIRQIVREEIARQDQRALPSFGSDRLRYLSLLRSAMDTGLAVIGVIVTAGLLTFLIPFYFFFFSVAYPKVQAFASSLIPDRHRERTLDLLRQMDVAVAGFVRGRLVISAIVALVLAVGWLICGVPYSIVLGLVVGVFNLVPYLSAVGLPLALGLMVFDQLALPEAERMGWFWMLAGPTIVFAIAQLLDGYVLTPLIAGKATDLDPVTILVAVLAGGALAGFYGMLLAIPAAACLKILLREVLLPRVKRWTEGKARDPLPM